ncbi:MAG TPA: XdhC family protein [Acetobacteraceae bacterium]|jgi:xanthine dehydrogenase accessory factor|nr:XdhC family protein [Acetobacteraceae bacterium]
MTPEILAALTAAREAKRPVVVATRMPGGEQMMLPSPDASPELAAAAKRMLARDESGTLTVDGVEWFLNAYNPPIRVVVIGAVHIAQALVPMAAELGLAVVVVDPRRSFASDERFPNATMMTDWPDEAMDALKPDSRTAVIALTHDPKLDDVALDRALKSEAFYIGALGSRKNHANRLRRLRELGHSEEALARIRGPVGLDIGAITAPEIALSILAEFTAVRRNARSGQTVPKSAAAMAPA